MYTDFLAIEDAESKSEVSFSIENVKVYEAGGEGRGGEAVGWELEY